MRLNILSIALTLAGLSAAAPSLGFEIERQKNFTSNAAEPKKLRLETPRLRRTRPASPRHPPWSPSFVASTVRTISW